MRFWDRGGDEPNEYCPERVAALCRCEASGHSMKTYTAADFKGWGAQGGAKSKRVLTTEQAKAMVAAREKKRRKTKRVTRSANTTP